MASAFGPFIPWNTPASVKRVATGTPPPTSGSSTTSTRTSPKPRTSPQKNPEKLAELKKRLPRSRRGQQGLPDRCRQLAAPPPRRPRQDALHRAGHSRQTPAACPSSPLPASAVKATRSSIEIEVPGQGQWRALRPRRRGGGLSVYLEDGHLVYQYNMMIIEKYTRPQRSSRSPPASTPSRSSPRSQGPGKAGTVTVQRRRQEQCRKSNSHAPSPPPSPPASPSTSASTSARPSR